MSDLTAAHQEFNALVGKITAHIGDRSLDQLLEDDLNTHFAANSSDFRKLADAMRAGIREGWLCNREHGGIRYGRIIKPGAEAGRFSVDVVLMDDLAGPHHAHPNGEIDMIVPERGAAEFDGRPAGWLVYGPGTAHSPTVSKGSAIVLYLLPEGAIEFTR